MEIIDRELNISLDCEKYIEGRSCFFDIETTGLSPRKDMVYLIGLLYKKNSNQWIIRQFFAESILEEDLIIRAFFEQLDNFDNLISFNGESFDIGFLEKRASILGIDSKLREYNSLDIYRLVRKDKDLLDLENLKLKSLEKYLGYEREDLYSGYECIAFYKEFLNNPTRKLKEKILRHNLEDLYYLPKIMKILDIIEEKKTIKFKDRQLLIKNYTIDGDFLLLDADFNNKLKIDIYDFNSFYNIKTQDRQKLKLELKLEKASMGPENIIQFVDLKALGLKALDHTNYQLPEDFYILAINQKIQLDNLKSLLDSILNK